ncbi:hypothetical protein WJX72_012139 [[Myrmecia] bisecta]|uniref:Thioredoxin domain-containing protein n=1 Tax=[Myrmecia] bisecta TaxID=41462 RepID=A0AAW1Q4T9_9CHLO
MFIHDLALGTSFEDLLVEVVSCHGVNAKTKAENPVYSATVADATGYVTLIYRTSTNCRPSNVKKGKCYMVSGKVTSHKGHLQIQIGSSWGRVSLVHGESVASKPAYSPATDLSAPERLYACMLLRQQGGGIQVWSYMTHDAAAKPGPGCPFPAVHADYAETGQSAAARAADTLLELKPASFRLFSLPTVAHFTAGTVPKITAAHLAVLNNPSDRFAVGALGGSWTDLASLHERVPPDWAAVVGMARQQLQAAAAAGLADLQFPASGPASTANGSDVQVPSTPAQDRCSTEPATEKPASSSAPAATLTGGNVCEPFPAWMPGRVLEISGGAAQVQGVLDSMQQPLAVINWHAAWCQPCQALVPALDRLAGQHPQVAFLQLDVVSTPENRALALEKVVVRRDSRRQGSYMRPQLKSANKFPCLSVHQPPSLQMIELCEGEPALGAVCGGPGKGKKALRPATDGLPGIYDPPVGKLNKAGATRRYPGNQVGHYWPKMPCLHCGCPWWLGEDWDARCARCTWTCENDGYDDDSNPLPKFAKTWAAFTAVIQSGRTPDWNPGN